MTPFLFDAHSIVQFPVLYAVLKPRAIGRTSHISLSVCWLTYTSCVKEWKNVSNPIIP